MFKKIEVSLWDIFTLFLSGLFLFLLITAHLLWQNLLTYEEFRNFLIEIPASIQIIIIPFFLTLIGLVIEPLARAFWSIFKKTNNNEELTKRLKKEIELNYLGNLKEKCTDTFQFCKNYVEIKKLTTTYATFLAKYGFYRSLSFICLVFAPIDLYILGLNCLGFLAFVLWIILASFFKKRSDDFYSYQAPEIYHCFLIDKLNK